MKQQTCPSGRNHHCCPRLRHCKSNYLVNPLQQRAQPQQKQPPPNGSLCWGLFPQMQHLKMLSRLPPTYPVIISRAYFCLFLDGLKATQPTPLMPMQEHPQQLRLEQAPQRRWQALSMKGYALRHSVFYRQHWLKLKASRSGWFRLRIQLSFRSH